MSNKWISVKDQLPDCNKTPNSFGVEVLVYPPIKNYGCSDANTAFFGCRITDEPSFYLWGALQHEITHWMPIPAPPGEKNVFNPVQHVKRMKEQDKKICHLTQELKEVKGKFEGAQKAISKIRAALDKFSIETKF